MQQTVVRERSTAPTCGRSPCPEAASGVARLSDDQLVVLLRARDEAAYEELVRRYTPLMLRLVRRHVPGRACAEEVVQDTWLAVVTGIDGFEGRAVLRTWLMRILMNTARTRGHLERRFVPMSSAPGDTAPWDRLLPPTLDLPLHETLQHETFARLRAALEDLPPRQRAVFVLRDVEGRTSAEVCTRLGVSTDNQRVLLHRARRRLRDVVAVPGSPPRSPSRVTVGPPGRR